MACFLDASYIARLPSHCAAYSKVEAILVVCDPLWSRIDCNVASAMTHCYIPTAPGLDMLWVVPSSAEGE